MARRGRFTQELDQDGAMAAVSAPEARLLEAIQPYENSIAVAAVNGPESTVLSGERKYVERVLQELAADGIQHTMLKVSHAFHSPLVEPMIAKLERVPRK